MKKLNGHHASGALAKSAKAPAKTLPGKAVSSAANKRPLPPLPTKDAKRPPLRAAKGDDDLMSEEPSVSDRG